VNLIIHPACGRNLRPGESRTKVGAGDPAGGRSVVCGNAKHKISAGGTLTNYLGQGPRR